MSSNLATIKSKFHMNRANSLQTVVIQKKCAQLTPVSPTIGASTSAATAAATIIGTTTAATIGTTAAGATIGITTAANIPAVTTTACLLLYLICDVVESQL